MVIHSARSAPALTSPASGQANSKEVTMKTDQLNPAAHAAIVTRTADMMTAMVDYAYGEAEDVVRLEQIDRPTIGDGDVLVRVHAAGLDRGVWHAMTGLPYPIRLAG